MQKLNQERTYTQKKSKKSSHISKNKKYKKTKTTQNIQESKVKIAKQQQQKLSYKYSRL